MSKVARRTVRCAIYTRKSSEEGLEQSFNSLDAQREACEAYVLSQKHEGWQALTTHYDDGGISGGTMNRPALQALLADIKMRRIDIVVVYKVDRLTRSLGDFARIVEIFDAQGVSFVSVTQQFNTSTSMGRLTLNVLLSFAQFEREVTGERIRDKIAASKKKGMWMGGNPPLGYEIKDRALVVNPAEAETVRHIFQRYVELGSVPRLKTDLDAAGFVSKSWTSRAGKPWGGKPMARGALYAMLSNRLYRGDIVHKDNVYPGEHEAIVDDNLWDEVQATLSGNRVKREQGTDERPVSLLTGILYDEAGNRMSPSHSTKGGRRYRYYVSAPLIRGNSVTEQNVRRLPAGEIERLTIDRLHQFFGNENEVLEALGEVADAGSELFTLVRAARALAADWGCLPGARRHAITRSTVRRVDIRSECVEVNISIDSLRNILSPSSTPHKENERPPPGGDSYMLIINAQLQRNGIGKKLVIAGSRADQLDPSLIKLLARAIEVREKFLAAGGMSINAFSAKHGMSGSYVTRHLRLSYIAPLVVKAFCEGKQLPTTTASGLITGTNISCLWDAQVRTL